MHLINSKLFSGTGPKSGRGLHCSDQRQGRWLIHRPHKGGFTLIEVMVVLCLIALLAAISIPNYARSRSRAQKNACINNLRLIDWAKQQWALEERGGIGAPPTKQQIAPYLGRTANIDKVVCPAGGDTADFDSCYSINRLNEPPTCNIDAENHHMP